MFIIFLINFIAVYLISRKSLLITFNSLLLFSVLHYIFQFNVQISSLICNLLGFVTIYVLVSQLITGIINFVILFFHLFTVYLFYKIIWWKSILSFFLPVVSEFYYTYLSWSSVGTWETTYIKYFLLVNYFIISVIIFKIYDVKNYKKQKEH